MYSVATPVTPSAAFFIRPVPHVFKELPPRPRPPAQRVTRKSLASRLYRGTGNKSRPVFASLRRKVERRSSECLTKAGRCFGSAHRDVSRPDQLDKYVGAAASAPLHRASKLFWKFGFHCFGSWAFRCSPGPWRAVRFSVL